MLVAVYGTLKRGYGNNRYLASSRYVCDGVVRGYQLFNSGFPVAAPSTNDTISVEVWDIGDDEHTLKGMDSLEGYRGEASRDTNMYNRETVSVLTDDGTMQCNMYVGSDASWRGFQGMTLCPINDEGHYEWAGYQRPRGRMDVA